jgi:hypothetical protein
MQVMRSTPHIETPEAEKEAQDTSCRGLIEWALSVIASKARQSWGYRGVYTAITALERDSRGKSLCRESGGIPQLQKGPPKIGGYRGLIKTISAVS